MESIEVLLTPIELDRSRQPATRSNAVTPKLNQTPSTHPAEMWYFLELIGLLLSRFFFAFESSQRNQWVRG